MPTSTRLKLKTNVALTGFAKYANYYKGKKGWTDPEDGKVKDLPDNIQLKGSWDGTQDDSLFLPVALLGTMLDMGLVRQEQTNDKFGNPAYTVVNQTRKIRVIKIETGEKNKKKTYISWADAPPPESNPAPAQPAKASPSAPVSQPQKKPAAPAPARPADVLKNGPVPEVNSVEKQKLDRIKKQHRKALKTIGDTQANAWRGAKYQVDLLLGEWSLEKTKIPTHVYLDLIARFGATSSIEAFKQQLIVEHRKNGDSPAAAPGVRPQAGSLAGAGALRSINTEPPALEPVAEREEAEQADAFEPPEPEPLDAFPDVLIDDEDDLPF
jgi:hypothetical protein